VFHVILIGFLQTGCYAPGHNRNHLRTEVLLPFRPLTGNSIHPLRRWWLTYLILTVSAIDLHMASITAVVNRFLPYANCGAAEWAVHGRHGVKMVLT
jgi:hypothetical protein